MPAQTITYERQEVDMSIPALISRYSALYEVSEGIMWKVINCENRDLDPKLQSYHPDPTGPNGREDSWGIVQIHLPSWKGQITWEQATDPEFSIRFLAQKLAEGKGHLWTCYRLNTG